MFKARAGVGAPQVMLSLPDPIGLPCKSCSAASPVAAAHSQQVGAAELHKEGQVSH